MIDADDSLLLRRSLHPAALAALRTEGRFRDLSRRVLAPERTALREARQVVADVLFGLSPSRVRRFEARGVLHFDLDSPSALGDATREAWEAVCSRLDLPWVDDEGRRFFDHTVRSWHTRDGQRVRVHRQGTGGGVDVRSIAEDELLDADDPAALLRERARGPLLLEHPPTLRAVVSIASAYGAVSLAEALAREAVKAMAPAPRVVWRVEDRARLLATRASEIAVLRRGLGALEEHAERTGAWQRFHPAVHAPFEAVLAIYEAGMLLESITTDGVFLVCPATD